MASEINQTGSNRGKSRLTSSQLRSINLSESTSVPIEKASKPDLKSTRNAPNRDFPRNEVAKKLTTETKEDIERKKKNLFLQGLFPLIGAIAFGLLFILAILPVMISVTAKIKMESDAPAVVQMIPQAPILNAPPLYSQESEIVISGYGDKEAVVQLVVNGSQNEKYKTEVREDGSFYLNVILNEGENTIAAFSKYEKDVDSSLSKTFEVLVDTKPPEIIVTNMENGLEIVGKANAGLQIEGQTDPSIKVYVNDRLTRSNAEGFFKIVMTLTEGNNNFIIKAIDNAENEGETTLDVTFKP